MCHTNFLYNPHVSKVFSQFKQKGNTHAEYALTSLKKPSETIEDRNGNLTTFKKLLKLLTLRMALIVDKYLRTNLVVDFVDATSIYWFHLRDKEIGLR